MKTKKCFLSFSHASDSQYVRDVLQNLGVKVIDPVDALVGVSLAQSVRRKLLQSDFAIFVLEELSNNLAYEIGLCDGLEKPYMLLLKSDLELPPLLARKPSISLGHDNKEFLELTINQFLRTLHQSPVQSSRGLKISYERSLPSREPESQNMASGKQVFIAELLERIHKIRQGDELEFFQVLENLFSKLNLKVMANYLGPVETGVDFALWSNPLGRTLGNPIVVEVKTQIRSDDALLVAEEQLKANVRKSDARIGILIYLGVDGRRFHGKHSLDPLILTLEFEELLHSLHKQSFERVILNYRNQIAHQL